MAKPSGKQVWHADYWKAEKHGQAWAHVRDAMKRDWEQTKSDLKPGDSGLNQGVEDTVKQAMGKEPIPAPGVSNPRTRNEGNAPTTGRAWTDVEPAFQYGHAARQEYGQQYQMWNEKLESQLKQEWDEKRTGATFEEAKPYVRRGWEKQP